MARDRIGNYTTKQADNKTEDIGSKTWDSNRNQDKKTHVQRSKDEAEIMDGQETWWKQVVQEEVLRKNDKTRTSSVDQHRRGRLRDLARTLDQRHNRRRLKCSTHATHRVRLHLTLALALARRCHRGNTQKPLHQFTLASAPCTRAGVGHTSRRLRDVDHRTGTRGICTPGNVEHADNLGHRWAAAQVERAAPCDEVPELVVDGERMGKLGGVGGGGTLESLTIVKGTRDTVLGNVEERNFAGEDLWRTSQRHRKYMG